MFRIHVKAFAKGGIESFPGEEGEDEGEGGRWGWEGGGGEG